MNDQKKYHVVVTGASGYLGQHCLCRLIEDGLHVDQLVVYALHQTTPEIKDSIQSYLEEREKWSSNDIQIEYVTLDFSSSDACRDWFETLRMSSTIMDCCIHTAAISSPAICEKDTNRAMAINVPEIFLDGLYNNNPQIKVIAISTDQIYDGNTSTPYDEDSTCDPCNVYGKTKVELEKYILDRKKIEYPKSTCIILRSSIILGPLAPFLPMKAHSTFLHFCQSRIDVETTYYTDEIRSVIAVTDVIQVILHMIRSATCMDSGVYCMGGPHPVSRYDMAVAVLSYFQVPLDVAVPTRKSSDTTQHGSVTSPMNISMCSSKLLSFIGMSEFMPLHAIVTDTFEHFAPQSQ